MSESESEAAATASRPGGAPTRVDGYAPIGDYGAIGDGRATALVGRDGSIDWWCLPAHDSGSVFGALLDAEGGGAFELRPAEDGFSSEQRYWERTNILETTFRTASGVVRVTDAVTKDGGRLLPWAEVVRRVECLSGEVRMRWAVRPRFGHGTVETQVIQSGQDLVIAQSESGQMGILAWGLGEGLHSKDAVEGEDVMRQGEAATLACVFNVDEPLPVPERDEVEDRLERTAAGWRDWLDAHDYEGPWRDEVERSLLVLQLLTARDGSLVAAATTSLPERIGGDRNFDYRHSWPRDTSFALDALLQCGLREPAHVSFAWLLRALENTHPRVQPIYRLSGEVLDHENELSLPGYRGSRPVREGNSAAGQLQLGAYGDLLYTAKLYTELGNRLDGGTGQRMAENVNLLCEIWRNEDASIWELNDSRHYTVSKMGSWLALRCALDLAEAGQLPDDHTKRWRAEQRAIEEFVEGECWSEERESYVMHPGTDSIDVACVLMGRMGYDEVAGERFGRTIDAVRSELVPRWPFVHRYSGMQSEEGAFVACTFWLVEALAHMGKADEAAELMEGALGIANHVGLLSEEVDPSTGELLGNFPQALSHLALINAAAAINNR